MGQIADFIVGFTVPAIICFVLGLALLIVEMFTPGYGAPGILGLILLVAAVVLRANSFFDALLMIVIILVVLGIAAIFVFRSATKGVLSRSPLVLKDSVVEKNQISKEDMQFFLGKQGKALSTLRPAGMADFNGVKLDVVSEGDFIQKGAMVTVVLVDGMRIVVRESAPAKHDTEQ